MIGIKWICFCLLAFYSVSTISASTADLVRNIIYNNEVIYILSNVKTSANEAVKYCSDIGGKLAEFTNYEIKNYALPKLIEEYIPEDLVQVLVYEHPMNGNFFKYQTSDMNLTQLLNSWEPPAAANKLKSFRLYKNSTGVFTRRLQFCNASVTSSMRLRDIITREATCLAGFLPSEIVLYDATQYTNDTIRVYNHMFKGDESIDIGELLLYKRAYRYLSGSFEMFIPDISVFTGARSDASTVNWFWTNGSRVMEADYTVTAANACRQMSLPLTYDNGINLFRKNCETETAYFMCEVKVDYVLRPSLFFQRFISQNSFLFALSKFEASSNYATSICSSAGGKLAQITRSKKNIFMALEEEYVSDLALVRIYQNPDNVYYLKFRTDNFNDPLSIEGWNNTSTGRLKSFRMYKEAHSRFTQEVFFQYVKTNEENARDFFSTEFFVHQSWPLNFNLYAATDNTDIKTLQLSNVYRHNNTPTLVGRASAVFLENEKIPDVYTNSISEKLYIPDISIFIGARSDVNQTNWFWENETMVDDSNYPTSDSSVCQQMSLPLTYDDGINLLPKDCENDEAHYVCEIPFFVSVQPLPCSSSLELSWNIGDDKVLGTESSGYMQIEVLNTDISYDVSYNQSTYILENLTGNTDYTIMATATIHQPFQITLTSSVNGRTNRIPPQAVEVAHLNSSSASSCIIQWLHEWSVNDPGEKPTMYEIQIHDQRGMVDSVSVDLPDDDQQLNRTKRTFQYGVDLSLYLRNTTLNFMIRAGTSCGFSEVTMVNGTCETPRQIETFQQSLALSNDTLIILSSIKKNATEARRICSSLGGSLAVFDNYGEESVHEVLDETYVKDLVLVTIFQNPNHNYTYKFQAEGFPNIYDDVSNWSQPMTGILKSFRLHRIPFGSFTQRVKFCYAATGARRSFSRMTCNAGWNSDFDLFGGTEDLNTTVTLYNYARINISVASNLLLDNTTTDGFTINPNAINPIFIPDIRVFTGARSDVGQTNWCWESGTIVEDSNYKPSNSSVCQQMSLPLTYDDGINLLPKDCENDEAYFVCEVQLNFKLEKIRCNATALILSWSLGNIFDENVIFEVEIVDAAGTNQSLSVPFSQSNLIITNLQKHTNYTLTTSVPLSRADGSILSSTLRTTTDKSPIARPVEIAYINQSEPSSCIVQWLFKGSESDSFERPTRYELQVINGSTGLVVHNATIQPSDSDSNTPEVERLLQYTVDWSLYPPNTTLSFAIRAGTRCGWSESLTVNGTCNSPPPPKPFEGFLALSNDSLVLLSSTQKIAGNANRTCSEFYGTIASIGRNDLNHQILINTYTKDLAKVEIFQNPNPGSENYYRFQVRNFSEWRNVSEWNVPMIRSLRSFRLYKKPFGYSNTRVKFCEERSLDTIVSSCSGTRMTNFDLFGGSNSNGNFIQVNNYRNQSAALNSTILLFAEESISQDFVLLIPASIYIPDISVFTGARSDKGQTDWFLENGTMVDDSNYPTSDSSVCEQMSLPLTYDDGINLLPKRCDDDEAYFACEVPFSFSLSEVECNAKAMQLSWNYGNSIEEEATLQITVVGLDLNYSAPFNQENFIMNNLEIQTNFTVEVSLDCTFCDDTSYVWRLDGNTEIGLFGGFISDPVVDSDCMIEWTQSVVLENTTSYRIELENNNATIMMNVEQSSLVHLPPGTFQYTVDLSEYEEGREFTFQIQAIYGDCESEFEAVEGTCSFTSTSNSDNLTDFTGPGIGIAIALLLVIIIVAVLLHRRKTATYKSSQPRTGAVDNPYSDMPRNETSVETAVVQFHRKEPFEEENQQQTDTAGNEYACIGLTGPGVAAENLRDYYAAECKDGFVTLEKEFKNIVQTSKDNEKEHNLADHPQNKTNNRYKNIYPYDHAAVRLEGNRYINAAHIKGYDKAKAYIATQGPKPQTVDAFWEMVWMQKTSVIVMLCKCVENNKIKCEKYWPELSNTMVRNAFVITAATEQNLGDIIKRTFDLRNLDTGEQRTITQFHYINWPDHGVPTTTSSMVYLRHLVNKKHFDSLMEGPIIVHCSAGAGRTGAYIAIDYLTQQLQEEAKVDVMKLILTMREYRKDMVQNVTQYIYVHKIVVESYILPKCDHDVEEFLRFLPHAVGAEYLRTEFNCLLDPVITTPTVIPKKGNPDNVYLNETTESQFDVNIYRKLQDEFVTMNATSINAGYFPGTFIAAAGPKVDKEDEFWEMILIENCQIVVAMERLTFDSFTQKQHNEHDVVQFGNIILTVNEVDDQPALLIHHVTISKSDDPHESLEITHVLVKNINDDSMSTMSAALVDAAERIKESMIENEDSSALVYCSDGMNKTGLLLAVAMIVERIKNEGKVDVLRTVKDLRDYRPGIMSDFDEYERCYSVIGEYLQTISV